MSKRRCYSIVLGMLLGLICSGGAVPAQAADGPAVTQPGSSASQTPLGEVRSTIDELVQAVSDFPGEEHLKQRRDKLRAIITPRFDFQEMARLSLGTNWTVVSPEEQTDFVKVFSDLLAKTYLDRIENIRKETVKVNTEKVIDQKAIVKTLVTHKGETFPIDYKLVHKGEQWKVYDVVIENIGLVTNYRNEFAGIIRKEQFAGLMKRLREKTGAQAKAS
ncbi:MAG: ABC transporter substrate-binding protein [Oligoflexia bacterium]|nr:ABC transporter substrate-binding protein [Oligoflexia bacterium]